jgi:hypothetical protein
VGADKQKTVQPLEFTKIHDYIDWLRQKLVLDSGAQES